MTGKVSSATGEPTKGAESAAGERYRAALEQISSMPYAPSSDHAETTMRRYNRAISIADNALGREIPDLPGVVAQTKRQAASKEEMREVDAINTLALVASAKDNEITGYPFWIIVDPRQLMSPTVSSLGSMVKGLFFSRENADAYIASHRHRYSKRVGVFCCSGNDSPEYRALYAASRKLQAPATPPDQRED